MGGEVGEQGHARPSKRAGASAAEGGPSSKGPARVRGARRAACGVRARSLTAIDDDVALLRVRQDLLDEVVDGLAGLDQQHHAARLLEAPHQLLDRLRADDLGALGLVGKEVVDLGDSAVERGHGEAVVVHVEDEVLAHHGQADEPNVSLCLAHP